MKLSCLQKNLNRGITIVEKAISRNTTLPILSNILFETDRGRLKLSATDLEIGINCWVGAKIEKPGRITIPAQILSGFVNSLPNKKINLSVQGNNVNLRCENFKVLIKGLPAKDFPLIPKIKEKPLLALPVPAIQRALTQVISAAASTQTRPEISGVLLVFEDDEVRFVATDSYRLAEKKIRNKQKISNPNPIEMIIPARTIQELIRIFTDQEGDVKIALSENQVLFNFGNINIISRLIEGQYPDYQQIIPSQFKSRAVIETREVVNAIKIASLFASKTDEIKIKFKKAKRGKDVLEIKAESGEIGSNISQVPAKIEGKNVEISFNYHYLLDGFNHILTDMVSFEVNEDKTPAVLKPFTEKGKRAKDKDYLYLIMPIKG
jgi:DNA polymerase-3 subunit beta